MLETAFTFELTEVPATTFAFVVRRVDSDHDHIGEFIRGGISRVHDFAVSNGGVLGAPMVISSPPEEDGSLILEVGWPVGEDAQPCPPVEVRHLPATRAAVHRHLGPYDELGPSFYRAFLTALHEQGLTPADGPRERYLAEGLAEVVWPLKGHAQ
jgi:effector-binding domain-containing protein